MRLIDADAVVHDISKWRLKNLFVKISILAKIILTPTVDALPVIRCKDCKYCEKGVCLTYRGLYAFVSDMEYCSRAERRDSDETD